MIDHSCSMPAALHTAGIRPVFALPHVHRKQRLDRRAICPPCAAKDRKRSPKNGTPKDAEGASAAQQQPGPLKSSGGKDEKRGPVDDSSLNVDDFNPVVLGRKSRQLLNDVWKQFTQLSSPVSSAANVLDEDFTFSSSKEVGEFETPQAASTTVLVVGGTGRVGRVLVRKLVLRGYAVRVLARDAEAVRASLPAAVQIAEGDLADTAACRAAIEGADKVVYCARSRTGVPDDVALVEQEGVTRLARELQDLRNASARKAGQPRNPGGKVTLADKREFQAAWTVQSPGAAASQEEEDTGFGGSLIRSRRSKYTPASRDTGSASINDRSNLVFEGSVHSRGGSVQVGAPLDGRNLGACEGLLLRACGDGQSYQVVLTQEGGQEFSARFATQLGFLNFRLPFSTFRYASGGEGPGQLDPTKVCHMAIRFENPKAPKAMPAIVNIGDAFSDTFAKDFTLEVDRIKALPGGLETDFIMVSCAGAAPTQASTLDGEDEEGTQSAPVNGVSGAQALSLKRRAEAALRSTGLGYTVVRPGPLLEEPGGYKALVFDQGERITQGISFADVADVCLKALHDPAARNKTFEVCHEYTPEEGLEQYELVAHLPDKANNYLGPALAVLEKNT